MTEREKKDFNQAPSDPRRRRRISESSATKHVEPQAIKKSPRADEPPSKIKRSSSNLRTYMPNVTRKFFS